mmetsp:Transcript_167432/g.406993  ORF Transcript_167432/g.406993 Transcript_167432/m.406993 type:complete len:129 (+) Transcript_167432:119-505(+)
MAEEQQSAPLFNSKEQHDEMCCSYAALILSDAGAEVTADSLSKLISASSNEVEPYWPALFAGLCKDRDLEEMLLSGGGGGGAGGDAGGAGGDAGEEEKKEESASEEEEVDLGGAGGLFGDEEEGGGDY